MNMLEHNKVEKDCFASEDLVEILSSLNHNDALLIFQEAYIGIEHSTETIRKLGLTQKRYYARLKQLIDSGLVQKFGDGGYALTFLGKILYQILYRKLRETLKNKDRLALIDNLNKSEALSDVEKKKLSKAITTQDKVIGYSVDFNEIRPVEIIRSFDELIEVVVKLLNKAEKQVYFASRYTDTNVIGPILKVFKRGVKLFVIDGDTTNLTQKMSIIKLLFSDPGVIKGLYDLVNSEDIQIKYHDIPYSFAVIDGKYAIFEVVNPIGGGFLYGFWLKNEEICDLFIEMFLELAKKGKKDPISNILTSKKEALSHLLTSRLKK